MSGLIEMRRDMMLRSGGGSSTNWEALLKSILDGTATNITTFPSGITELRKGCFRDFINLVNVVVPEGVTKLQEHMFNGCTSLKSVSLPSTLTSMGSYAFLGCKKLENITIPSGITNLGQQSFQSCNALEYMILQSTTPPTIYSSTFNSSTTCLFYVPDSAVNTYKGASEWSNYSSRIFSINDLTTT